MSAENTLNFVSGQFHIYFGFPVLILGVIGEVLNVIVFCTLKTFRKTTCAFYLTSVAVANVGELLIASLIRILSEGLKTDIRKKLWVCKLHIYIAVWCLLVSLTGMCLATIDQYISMTKYRHWSNMRAAQRNVLFACVMWAAYSISFTMFRETPPSICKTSSANFAIYSSYFHFPFLRCLLPVGIMVTFSILAFYKARSLISHQVNIVYLSRDRQLTAMTLVHVVFVVLTTVPYVIFYIYSLNQTAIDPEQTARMNLIYVITLLIEYLSFASSFYIYCCVSERFRKQLLYVLTKLCVNRCRQWTHSCCSATRIAPMTELAVDEQPGRNLTLDEAVSIRYIAK